MIIFFKECDCKKKVKPFQRTVDYFVSSSPIKSFVKMMGSVEFPIVLNCTFWDDLHYFFS